MQVVSLAAGGHRRCGKLWPNTATKVEGLTDAQIKSLRADPRLVVFEDGESVSDKVATEKASEQARLEAEKAARARGEKQHQNERR